MDPLTSQLLCGGMRRCQEEAIECCRTKGGDTRLISFLLGIERQRQLLGITDGSCGGGLDLAGSCGVRAEMVWYPDDHADR